MDTTPAGTHWLDHYASDSHQWQSIKHDGHHRFYRPLGLVEFGFDADARSFEGRADISMHLVLSIRSNLDRASLQRHLTLSWTCLRTKHVLAQALAPLWQRWMKKPQRINHDHCLLIDLANDATEAVSQASAHIVFVEGDSTDIDPAQFHTHVHNCGRVVDPSRALAKLFILPSTRRSGGSETLSCIFVIAHQIGDGISTSRWIPDFVKYLNMTEASLLQELEHLLKPDTIMQSLPPSQEALYPAVGGNVARQRWFWVLTRVLRHVRKPLPVGFENPLMRHGHTRAPRPFPRIFNAILDYDKQPPNQSTPRRAALSNGATHRLQNICKSADVSVGAGCFALAAVLMMEFYERQQPELSLDERKPFITGSFGFPINPRPWLVGNPAINSMMLAFSEGIVLPFLPSYLDLDGRMRLLARAAQRELAVYQKRNTVPLDPSGLQYMSSRGAGRMLAIQYLGSLERCEMLVPLEKRQGLNPQGLYAMRPCITGETCGVSSVGKLPPLNPADTPTRHDFHAWAEDSHGAVKARGGEFLVGIAGTDKGIITNLSIDGSSMDPVLVDAWLDRFTRILEPDQTSVSRL